MVRFCWDLSAAWFGRDFFQSIVSKWWLRSPKYLSNHRRKLVPPFREQDIEVFRREWVSFSCWDCICSSQNRKSSLCCPWWAKYFKAWYRGEWRDAGGYTSRLRTSGRRASPLLHFFFDYIVVVWLTRINGRWLRTLRQGRYDVNRGSRRKVWRCWGGWGTYSALSIESHSPPLPIISSCISIAPSRRTQNRFFSRLPCRLRCRIPRPACPRCESHR